MPDETFDILIRTRAELSGAQSALQELERGIGYASALGRETAPLAAQIDRVTRAIAEFHRAAGEPNATAIESDPHRAPAIESPPPAPANLQQIGSETQATPLVDNPGNNTAELAALSAEAARQREQFDSLLELLRQSLGENPQREALGSLLALLDQKLTADQALAQRVSYLESRLRGLLNP